MKLNRKFLPIKRNFSSLDKRQRFVLQTVLLTSGLLITQLIWEDSRFIMVVVLSVLSYILTAWSLTEDITGVEWLLLFILPVSFTASVSLFYFLLPGRWITRLSVTAVFAVGTYAALLVENIYNVAAARSVPLLRAAHSIGLLVSLVVIFLTSNIIYSLRLPFGLNLIFTSIVSFILSLQSLWSVKLDDRLSKRLLVFSGIISLGVGEMALVLSFWPVGNSSFSLLLTATYYSLVGIFQQYIQGRLFNNVIREYLSVFLFSLILTLITTVWG